MSQLWKGIDSPSSLDPVGYYEIMNLLKFLWDLRALKAYNKCMIIG